MKWLIVDDSAMMRRIVKHGIHETGEHEFLEASDGRQALKLCDASIDFVITDWNMPVMGGLELVKQIRANPEWAGLTILMVSSLSSRKDVVSALESGVNGYILKPFTVQTLTGKIEELLAHRPKSEDANTAGIAPIAEANSETAEAA